MNHFIKLFTASLLVGALFTACERKPVVRFAVISDTHVGHPRAAEKISRTLKLLCSKQPRIDAIFVVGDLTHDGTLEQYELLASLFGDQSLIPKDVSLYLMLGNNHDKTREGGKERFMQTTGQPLRHYAEIKGYPFVAFSEGGSRINEFNEDALQWLDETMSDAAKKYRGKPIFVFSHVPPLNTCYGSLASEGWGTDLFLPVYNRYPQAVVFGGHSHFPIGDPRSIHQGAFTSINDGSVYYSEVAKGEVSEGIHPANNHEVTEGLIVNIMSDGSLDIERWDTYRDEEILPRWTIAAPHDGSRFIYNNRDGLPAPAFAPDAQLNGRMDGNEYEIVIPQATDNEVVFKYRIDLLDGDSVAYSRSVFSQFYLNSDMPSHITQRLAELPCGKTLTVRVTAVDSYGNCSEPLVGETFSVPSCN